MSDPRDGQQPRGWDAVTPAEWRVAVLVAEGISNREIADTLHISIRTVESHLHHMFAKLEVSSRTALAREVSRRST